jgi:hypothetical protein
MVLVKCPKCKEKIDVGSSFRGYRNCPNYNEKLIIGNGILGKKVELLNKKGFFERLVE